MYLVNKGMIAIASESTGSSQKVAFLPKRLAGNQREGTIFSGFSHICQAKKAYVNIANCKKRTLIFALFGGEVP